MSYVLSLNVTQSDARNMLVFLVIGQHIRNTLFFQGVAIFALVILLVSSETSSRVQDRVIVAPKLPEPKPHSTDRCCVKKRFYRNGRVSFQCRSEHPDCFVKSDPGSPLFGLCKSVVNDKNVVTGCECAAKIWRLRFFQRRIICVLKLYYLLARACVESSRNIVIYCICN